eukprot:CAMPEP_0197660576 /NCGR_PEP_ID=MMETSP1338-20131121/50930_1 /TAXON_ID=43686 ORGANISM="Pelagodinium beii, Strain RCC1491" /NCGR_SAMPLE_ID=MMETSP1338 /ASSEMBLY_ACC=CAM_ASM_000754 /LENGTH=152 /DNA_ID=CAMNT_0043237953 /DNA_START=81 /DNA_END=540 /DNA_ORIENTATION=-
MSPSNSSSDGSSPRLVVRNTFFDLDGRVPRSLQRSTSAPGRFVFGSAQREAVGEEVAVSEMVLPHTRQAPSASAEDGVQVPVQQLNPGMASSSATGSGAQMPPTQVMLQSYTGEEADAEIRAQVSRDEMLRLHEAATAGHVPTLTSKLTAAA